jgi:hypothetical protein
MLLRFAKKMIFFLFISSFSHFLCLGAEQKPFVIGRLSCQLGNNCFQIAAACAHAWDHGAEPYFPDLLMRKQDGMPVNYEHIFFRFNAQMPEEPIELQWTFPISANFTSCKIPYHPNMEISAGTYQSENYFKHYRERLLELFAPHPLDLEYIKSKYAHILEHPLTVGVQIRWFGCQPDLGWADFLVQYGYDYYEKAMSIFPEDTLFVISTNNLEFAQLNIPSRFQNVIYLNEEPHYIDFALLSMCKHNIISNSSFGWWSAWLNKNPDKIVVAPELWVDLKWSHITPVKDVWPENWLRLNAKWGKPADPFTSFR